MKQITILLFALAPILGLTFHSDVGVIAQATENETRSTHHDTYIALHEFWDQYGVDRSVQDDLIRKLEAGEVHDSDLGSVDPVEVRTIFSGDFIQEVNVFPDGSILVTGRQLGNKLSKGDDLLPPGLDATSLRGCRVSSGSGYSTFQNCTVFGSTATVQAFFVANYTIAQGQYNDSISWHGAPGQQCAGAVCDTPYFAHGNAKESSARPASATYFFRWTIAGSTSATGQISLIVGNNRASVDFKAKV